MTTRKSLLVSAAVVAVVALWYLFRPDALVISKTVNEPFPAEAHAMSAMAESPTMAKSGTAMRDTPAMAQSAMAEEPVKLTSGRFHKHAHDTKGVAAIYRLEDGRRVLRLTEFATSNGPDVRVYLVAADDVQDEASAKQAGFVDLGALKGNIGDQNYDVPADLDLSSYRAVSIWCRRFSVNFGAAPLAEIPS
ncbi:MAG TPA: DM13 domain-containing protein [Gemmatimonadales bacterium]|nr:DM13 domain-containing protein [Gemmatimonadales bacterium]